MRRGRGNKVGREGVERSKRSTGKKRRGGGDQTRVWGPKGERSPKLKGRVLTFGPACCTVRVLKSPKEGKRRILAVRKVDN